MPKKFACFYRFLSAPILTAGKIFVRPREREKVPEGRMRAVGKNHTHAVRVR